MTLIVSSGRGLRADVNDRYRPARMRDDPLHMVSPPGRHWTRANAAEAIPGVLTPLGWTVWSHAAERAARRTFYEMGVYTPAEREVPADPVDRILTIFHGRPTLRVDQFVLLGDRMPGTTGAEVMTSIFAGTPPGFVFDPTRRRYPAIAWRLPRLFLTNPRRLRRASATMPTRWRVEIDGVAQLDRPAAVAAFSRGLDLFYDNLVLQMIALFAIVQPVFDTLDRVSRAAGQGSAAALTGGYGGVPEARVVADLWRVSRGELTLPELVRAHGYHGPWEGEISGRVWREDPAPLEPIVAAYAERPDTEDPRLFEAQRRAQRLALERRLVAAVPRARRPGVRALIWIAARTIPLRGEAKGAFLQSLDIARAAARRLGRYLAADGALDDPEDVFYLTREELLGDVPDDATEVVAWRRARREEHMAVDVPVHWTGQPAVVPPGDGAADGVARIEAIGASPGVVEGRVRVVTDPTFAEVEPDEVLVAATTDPSWSAIMFISSALVMDTGGALSHAAVVARELGIPCVVNTQDGSRRLRTGDRVRVDGTSGTVEVIARAAT
jgi:phosphohistidine swiveling domain-containing protein